MPEKIDEVFGINLHDYEPITPKDFFPHDPEWEALCKKNEEIAKAAEAKVGPQPLAVPNAREREFNSFFSYSGSDIFWALVEKVSPWLYWHLHAKKIQQLLHEKDDGYTNEVVIECLREHKRRALDVADTLPSSVQKELIQKTIQPPAVEAVTMPPLQS